MDTLLQLAQDNWKFRQPALGIGVETGVVWAVRRGVFAGVDGCVMVPAEDHPWCAGFPPDYRDRFDVHGKISWDLFPWLGFDTSHAFDYWEPEFDPNGYQALLDRYPSSLFVEKRWTLGLVIEEAKSLARQLASVTE